MTTERNFFVTAMRNQTVMKPYDLVVEYQRLSDAYCISPGDYNEKYRT
jgi:hypothetical protein